MASRPCLPRPLLLCALLVALLPPCAVALPFWDGNSTVKVCVTDSPPMLYCHGMKSSDSYVGYEVAVFREVRNLLGWTNADVAWECLDRDEFEAARTNGTCDITLGIMSWDQDIIDGFTYSDSIYRGGLQIAVLKETKDPGLFSFMSVFQWEVWMAIVLTAVFIAMVVWTIDAFMRDPDPIHPPQRGYQEYLWEAMGRPMQTRDIVASSFAGNVVLIIFSFSMLVMVSLFTAQTASDMTVKQLNNQISGIADLRGKKVGTFPAVQDLLSSRYSLVTKAYEWDTTNDTEVMYDALRAKAIQALVMDSATLNIETATRCDIGLVGPLFLFSDQVICFRKGLNDSALITEVNKALMVLRDDGTLEGLVGKYITKAGQACDSTEMSSAIAFKQVAGLWILMACAVGVALVMVVAHRLHCRFVAPQIQKMKTFQRLSTSAGAVFRRATSFGSEQSK